MALTGTDRGGSATNTGGQSTLVVTPASNFAARSWACLIVAYDNSGASGADPYSSITDSVGNTWTPRRNQRISPGNAANDGQCLRAFTSDMSVAKLTTSDTITVSFGGTTTVARSWALHEILPGANGQVAYVTGAEETATTATPTITTSSITSGDLVIGAVGREGNEAPTGDSDTSNGSWSSVLGGRVGTTTAGSQCVTQRKVVTGTGTQTYNPTFGGTSRDGCEMWVQFRETASSFPACLFLGHRRRRM